MRSESVDGDADGLIEAVLALGENYAAEALDRLLAHPEELTEDDHLDLAFFVGMQEQRGPGFLTELKARMEESATMHAAVRLTNVRGSTKHQRQAQELRDDLAAGRVYLEMPMNNVLKMMLERSRRLRSSSGTCRGRCLLPQAMIGSSALTGRSRSMTPLLCIRGRPLRGCHRQLCELPSRCHPRHACASAPATSTLSRYAIRSARCGASI
jgi:Protein of unknown function (DUF4238)